MFENIPWETLLMVGGALGCYLLIRRMGTGKNDESRAGKMMEKYKTLTAENLAETDDEDLVEAVVCHVLSQAAEARRPDPAKELAVLPQPFTVVYSIWAVCKEMGRGDYKALTHTATKHLVDAAVDGLPVVGASATAEALAALRDGYASKEGGELHRAFHLAVEQEAPLNLCIAYIRDHVPQLLGDEPEEESIDEE